MTLLSRITAARALALSAARSAMANVSAVPDAELLRHCDVLERQGRPDEKLAARELRIVLGARG